MFYFTKKFRNQTFIYTKSFFVYFLNKYVKILIKNGREMFKSASEIKNLAEQHLFESTPFQQGVAAISKTVARNIENAAQNGKFTTNAHFETWYVNKHLKIIEAVSHSLVESGYIVSELLFDKSSDTQYLKISWV